MYRVDGEVGRFEFLCHHVVDEKGKIHFDTSREVFPELNGKERYKTIGFKELAIVQGTLSGSYRHTAQWLNRIRHQPQATPLRTLQDIVAAEGNAAAQALEEEAKRVVQESNIDPDKLLPIEESKACTARFLESKLIDNALVESAPDVDSIEVMRANPVGYEDPEVTVQVSIDDVLAKKQKEHRVSHDIQENASNSLNAVESEKPNDNNEKKRIHNTVAHVHIGEKRRIFTSASLFSTCLFIMAFMVANNTLLYNWMFFVDGQRSLQDMLLRLFSWQGTIQLILDWYHLVKKCKETLSLAMKNRHIRNEVLKPLLHLLWIGNVEEAINYLRKIDAKKVKSQKHLKQLIGYFERNRPYIPCYAVRKKLGLRNSSNRGEKSNDQLVSARQKHKGMSWSQLGSSALATLQSLVCNGKHKQWFETKTVDFCLAA